MSLCECEVPKRGVHRTPKGVQASLVSRNYYKHVTPWSEEVEVVLGLLPAA
jgi:hypothetical protein